jgi:hypothetical protein
MDVKDQERLFQFSPGIPSPSMGEGQGGGGRDEDLLVPPPLHPLPQWGGEIFERIMYSQLWTP